MFDCFSALLKENLHSAAFSDVSDNSVPINVTCSMKTNQIIKPGLNKSIFFFRLNSDQHEDHLTVSAASPDTENTFTCLRNSMFAVNLANKNVLKKSRF